MRPNGHRTNIALFATAHLLSAFGYEFLTFVLTVHIYELTKQALDVGVFMAVSFVPRLFSSFYGVLTDRYPRRYLFFAVCTSTAAMTLLLARQNSLIGIYAVWFAVSVLAMIVMNLRNAIMTQVMPGDNYLRVNGLMLVLLNTARLSAPVVGGIAATLWSASAVLSIASAVYTASAMAGLAINLPEVRQQHARLSGIFAHMREAMAMMWRNSDLTTLSSVAVVWRLCIGFLNGLLMVYVAQVLGKGRLEYGMLTSALAIGSILGGLVGPGLSAKLSTRTFVKAGMITHFLLVASFGLISVYPVALANAVLANFVLYATAVAVHSMRDKATPVDYRGRIYGCSTAITAPPALVSMLLGGWLADVIGVRAVFVGGGLLAVIGASIIYALSPQMRTEEAA